MGSCLVERHSSDVGTNGPGMATPGAVRNRPPSKMTKYVEYWGADKPFANITEGAIAKNIEHMVRATFFMNSCRTTVKEKVKCK